MAARLGAAQILLLHASVSSAVCTHPLVALDVGRLGALRWKPGGDGGVTQGAAAAILWRFPTAAELHPCWDCPTPLPIRMRSGAAHMQPALHTALSSSRSAEQQQQASSLAWSRARRAVAAVAHSSRRPAASSRALGLSMAFRVRGMAREAKRQAI